MPTLPLPIGGCAIDGGDLPVTDTTDVAPEWPGEFNDPPVAPVRDAIQCGQASLLVAYQDMSRYSAAQSDPDRATDEYEDECGEERSCFRQQNESNNAFRVRYLARPAVVSPAAIVAAANAVLAPYTTISCVYAEHSDGFFVEDGTATWSSHVFDITKSMGLGACPNYPNRLYAGQVAGAIVAPVYIGTADITNPLLYGVSGSGLDGLILEIAVNGGGTVTGTFAYSTTCATLTSFLAYLNATWTGLTFSLGGPLGNKLVITDNTVGPSAHFIILIGSTSLPTLGLLAGSSADTLGWGPWSSSAPSLPQRRPPGAMVTGDIYGRWFLLRAPDISLIDSELGAVFTGTETDPTDGLFVFSGAETYPGEGAFLFGFGATTVDDIYNAVIGAVNILIGPGIRWDFLADPTLTS
jgi:hypothetical protein